MARGRKAASSLAVLPPFLLCLRLILNDPATDALVSWNASNNGFTVWDPPRFSREILPNYYGHNNLDSFVRQLNKYGFKKNVKSPHWEYVSEDFVRGDERIMRGKFFHERGLELPPPANVENPSARERTDDEQRRKIKGKRKITDDEDRQSVDFQSANQRLLVQQMNSYFAKAIQTRQFEFLLASQMNNCNGHISGDVNRRRLLMNDQLKNVMSKLFMKTTASTITRESTKLSNSLANSFAPNCILYHGGSSSGATHSKLDVLPNAFDPNSIHPSPYNWAQVNSPNTPLTEVITNAHDNSRIHEKWTLKGSQEENVDGEGERTNFTSEVPDLSVSDYGWQGSDFSIHPSSNSWARANSPEATTGEHANAYNVTADADNTNYASYFTDGWDDIDVSFLYDD